MARDSAWERLEVKSGLSTLPRRMTRAEAMRYGVKHMPRDLKAAGFECIIAKADKELHGGVWFRISYGKNV